MKLINTCVKFCKSRSMHVWRPFVTNLKHEMLFECLPYEWPSGTSDGIFLPIYPPRSMCVVLGFDDL